MSSNADLDSKQDDHDEFDEGKESDVLFRYNSADRLEEKLIAEAKSPSSPLVKGMQLDLSFAAASKDTRYLPVQAKHFSLPILQIYFHFTSPYSFSFGAEAEKCWIARAGKVNWRTFPFKRAVCW